MTGGHIYDSWPAFATWLDQSNWSAALMSLVVPAIPLGVYTEWQHRRTRKHTEAHHASVHTRLDFLFGRTDPEENEHGNEF